MAESGWGGSRRDPQATWARFEALMAADAALAEARPVAAVEHRRSVEPIDTPEARSRRVAARLFELRAARRGSAA